MMNESYVDPEPIHNCLNTIRGVVIALDYERNRLRSTDPGRSLSIAITELETGALWLGWAIEQMAMLQATPSER